MRSALPLALLLLAAPAAAKLRLNLGVVIAVDQMRADYLGRGFERLGREGAVFTRAKHTHIPTETGPGHAAISTGRLPDVHGIVANDWYDRAAGRETYCMDDAPYGLGPGHLDGPTLADGLKAADPDARVFALSSKDRAAITLGGRKADVVLWFDRRQGEYVTSSYYRRPSWLDGFNKKLKASGRLPMKDGKVPSAVLASPLVDQVTRELASELLAREKVGRGRGTDLLLVSFSGTDTVGHAWGTQSPQMAEQLALLDKELSRLIDEATKAAGGRVSFALSADHGAVPEPEGPMGQALGIRRKDWLGFGKELEAALQKRWPDARKSRMVSYQVPHLYFDPPFIAEAGLSAIAKELAKVDGVAKVYLPEDVMLGRHDADPLAGVLKHSIRPDRSGDLLMVLDERVLLHDKVPGTSHGSPYDYDAAVPLVFWGQGVKPGHYEVPAAVIDLAPTMGRLLGFEYPAAEGGAVRVEALAP